MIVGDKRNWLKMVFTLRGSILRRIWPRVSIVTGFAIVVTWVEYHFRLEEYSLTTTPFALIGTAMAIFLGFRNNEAYDRYWEGRTLWGQLVNISRSFTRRTKLMIQPVRKDQLIGVEEIRQRLTLLNISFVNALRHHLRDTDPTEELSAYMSADDIVQVKQHFNRPVAILQVMGSTLETAWKAGYIKDFHVPLLEEGLSEMTNVQGGCERIKGTPIPFTYNVLIHRIVAVYCFTLPFGLFDTVGIVSPVVVGLISYAFFGLDAIGDEVEQPFERDANDLPLEAICRTIEINLLQLIGQQDVPDPIKPVGSVLL